LNFRRLIAIAALALAIGAVGCTPGQLAKEAGVYTLAEVRSGARVTLFSRPGGRRIARVGSKTGFGGDRVFWVVKSRGTWLGVTSADAKDNELAWVPYNPLTLRIFYTRWSVKVSLPRRELTVLYGNRPKRRFPVTLGTPGLSTPAGKFSVTDALAGKGLGPWYGCCALALTGHQHDLPPDWVGGDRIAIHGTPLPVGGLGSHGCVRASNPNMVYMFAKLPIGTPVIIGN
jgi:hypothetical protein